MDNKDIYRIVESDFAGLAKGANNKSSVVLHDPVAMPNATAFLWNKKMVVQVSCRGYVVAQHMQPEPAKYSYAPNIEAKTFIQPEHNYYAHHPGRFFYIKDDSTSEVFSVPYEPMRKKANSFEFVASDSQVSWQVIQNDLQVNVAFTLTKEDTIERWSVSVKNLSSQYRTISIYPYFSVGYMSWMNQSADFDGELNAIVANSITPYQKVEQYFENKGLKDNTFLVADKRPVAWHCNQQVFEGEGGLHNPEAIQAPQLGNVNAVYQQPVAVMQFKEDLAFNQSAKFNLLFGPAENKQEISDLKSRYLSSTQAEVADDEYRAYLAQGNGCITIKSEDKSFDDFVNHWLPRQIFYHGDVNRLSTDPQTRNYIQDAMGMCFVKPQVARHAFLTALSQQQISGAMPDGILLHEKAQLKYINQVPHSDHCVWLPICLSVYLSETGDKDIFSEQIGFADSEKLSSFVDHIELALDWLIGATDYRHLSLIEQGDWCDPMNMVGYQGKGVSSWLTMATIYAVKSWCQIAQHYQLTINKSKYAKYQETITAMSDAANRYFWDGSWYARGRTDDDVVFGSHIDDEGQIYLNPQSWSLLCELCDDEQQAALLTSVEDKLLTPFGAMMLAPSYTKMREDVGRLTQKHPGVSENGSVYNHAAVFYIYSLFQIGEVDQAFKQLKLMVPSIETALKTGQLPIYIPNYYRGAYYQLPEQAGRSSHLFNTGTIAWFYRCLVEELCGIKGIGDDIIIAPKLPKALNSLSGTRRIRDYEIDFDIVRADVSKIEITVNEADVIDGKLPIMPGRDKYTVHVKLPS